MNQEAVKYCECGSEAMKSAGPKVIIQFTIPFTQIEIIVWNWSHNDYEDLCSECFMDDYHSRENDRSREAYNSGVEDGYERAMKGNY